MKPWERYQIKPWERYQRPQTQRMPTRAESVQEELQERSVPEQVAAGVGASAAETYYGTKALLRGVGNEVIEEAIGEDIDPLSPEDRRRLEEWRAIRGGPAEVGRVVGDIAQVGLPAAKAYQAARVGRGLTRALAPITAESATVGAYEGLQPPEQGQTRLGQAGTGAALNLGIGTGMNVLGRAFLPKGFPKSQAALREEEMLRSVGIRPRIPLSMAAEPRGPLGRSLQWMHKYPLMDIPGPSHVLRGQAARSRDDWLEAMFLQSVPARARGEIKLPRQYAAEGAEDPVAATFKNIDDWYSKEYKRVLEPYDFQIMSKGPAGRMAVAYEEIPVASTRREVQEKFGEILAYYADDAGNIPGKAVSTFKKKVREAANSADDDVAVGLNKVLGAFENEIERQLKMTNMPHAIQYAELRAPYRNLATLRSAAARGKSQRTELSPDQLLEASRLKTKREMGESAVAESRGPLQAAAKRGTRDVYTIDPTKRQEGSVFKLGATLALTGMGGVANLPATLGVWGGILGTLPMGVQRYLMRDATIRGIPIQRYLEQVQRSPALQQALSAGRAGTTTGLMD